MKKKPDNTNNLLREVMEWGFVVTELVLYLDTHPEDREAYDKYLLANERYNQSKMEYERRYGALTVSSHTPVEYPWQWIEGPWPWEIEY